MPSSLNPEPGFLNTSEPLADIITPDPPPLLSADSSDTIMPSPIDKPLPAAPLAPLNDSFIVSTSSSPSNSRATRSTRIPRSTRPTRDHQRQTQERAQPIAINGTTADETGRDVPYMILAWRIWLCLEITLLILMLSLSIYALLKDREPCDSGVWVFALSSASVMLAQILLATGLLINLPNPKLGSTMRMTWEVYRRFVLSRCTFFMSFVISMVQIALIPAGIAIVKTADQKCVSQSDDLDLSKI
ncbi:hypothetical protein HDU79_003450 [Rhizoclosmatium sp. JEL0117]|nr:hypothetical protein HDU79_003450 [Rhizoclosmatium sp. JEL0117]